MARDAQIQMRRDTAANWTSANPTLAAGEYGFESDTGLVKIGDGTTAWTSLQYLSQKMNEWATAQDSTAVDTVPRFCATSTSTVSAGQLRVAAFTATRTFTVSNISAYVSNAATDGSGTAYRRMALYTISGTTITLVARTDSTPGLFTATGAQTGALSATGGYPTTYTLNAGSRYAVGLYCANSTGTIATPTFVTTNLGAGSIGSATSVINGAVSLTATADLPTTNQTLSATTVMPFFRLT